MEHLHKENLVSQDNSSVKRKMGNVDNVKKLKTIIKPLSDVKNILEDKISQTQQIKKDGDTENREVLDITEENHYEELFFYSEYDDNFEDIIPKSLQLDDDDLSKFVRVFDRFPVTDLIAENVEFLPVFEFDKLSEDFADDEICPFLKGIDSTSLLFEGIELRLLSQREPNE